LPLLAERLEDLEPDSLELELVLVSEFEELFEDDDGEILDEEILIELRELSRLEELLLSIEELEELVWLTIKELLEVFVTDKLELEDV
jgi:hypothetical protein